MKILVVSDSHGQQRPMERAVQLEQPDEIIHLGDCWRDAQWLSRRFPLIRVQSVVGNCDFGVKGPETLLLRREGLTILAMHGHRCHVKFGYTRAEYAALEAGADILLFGHTHVAYCEKWNGLWLFNPGACEAGSYGVIFLENGRAVCRNRRLERGEGA